MCFFHNSTIYNCWPQSTEKCRWWTSSPRPMSLKMNSRYWVRDSTSTRRLYRNIIRLNIFNCYIISKSFLAKTKYTINIDNTTADNTLPNSDKPIVSRIRFSIPPFRSFGKKPKVPSNCCVYQVTTNCYLWCYTVSSKRCIRKECIIYYLCVYL